MSEVTYKKVVDVEQIDTLGEDTTLFVNDGGSMKQMGAAALGAVKSVNGVTPDENGDVEVNAAEKIAFVYMPEMGDLLCEKTAAEIHELYSNVTTAHGLCFILRVYDFTNPMAPTPDYLYNKIEVESIQNGGTYYKLIYHIHFGDVVPPVLVDAINNTITLDPDWVAPEADPEPTGAHQMLVTGADGSTKWEDRTHWAEESDTAVYDGVPTWLAQSYMNHIYGFGDKPITINMDAEYTIVVNGVEYTASKGDGSGNELAIFDGETPLIAFSFDSYRDGYQNHFSTFAYTETVEHLTIIEHINAIKKLDPKYLPDDHINGMIDTKLEGAGGGSSDGVILVGQWDENDNYVYPDETLIAALTALKQGKAVAYKNDPDINKYSYILSWFLSPQSPDGYRYLNFYVHSSDTAEIEKIQIAVNPSIVPDGM